MTEQDPPRVHTQSSYRAIEGELHGLKIARWRVTSKGGASRVIRGRSRGDERWVQHTSPQNSSFPQLSKWQDNARNKAVENDNTDCI